MSDPEDDIVFKLRESAKHWAIEVRTRIEAADEIERLRAGLASIVCEPINVEWMAQNVLDGLHPYHVEHPDAPDHA